MRVILCQSPDDDCVMTMSEIGSFGYLKGGIFLSMLRVPWAKPERRLGQWQINRNKDCAIQLSDIEY